MQGAAGDKTLVSTEWPGKILEGSEQRNDLYKERGLMKYWEYSEGGKGRKLVYLTNMLPPYKLQPDEIKEINKQIKTVPGDCLLIESLWLHTEASQINVRAGDDGSTSGDSR